MEAKEGSDVQASGRDGLVHFFSAREGAPIPSDLTALKPAFWLFDVPRGFLGRVGQGGAASKLFFVYVLTKNGPQ